MDDRSSFDLIRDILIKQFQVSPEAITLEADLDSLGIDSLAVIEILFQVEEKLGMSLPDSRVPVSTLGDVVDLLDNLRRKAAPTSATAAEESK